MHIAFINTLYPPFGASGAEGTLRLLAQTMAARGHLCSVITLTPKGRFVTDQVDGITVHYLPLANVYWPHAPHRPRTLRPVFQFFDAANPIMLRRLHKILCRIAPDVVHAHNLQGFSATAWLAAQRAGIPLVQTLHDYYTSCPRSAMWRPSSGNCVTLCAECRLFGAPRRRLSHLPQVVTCVSHRVFDRIHQAGSFPLAGTATQPVRVIRGNNATDLLPPCPPLNETGSLRLGFMGRIDPTKGIETLLDAVQRLPHGTVTLAIAGNGPEEYVNALRARARKAVTFLGHVKPETFFPTIDLLTVPSIWEDPFPRVFHEALSFGVPSLVTPLGGLPEAIRPGVTGFIATGTGTDALHASLQSLLLDGWDRMAMQAQCRAASTAYAPARIADQYQAVLEAAAMRRHVPEDAGEPWHGPPRQNEAPRQSGEGP